MKLCALCGSPLPGDQILCPHHVCAEKNWAVTNQGWCDLLHRKKVPSIDPASDGRESDL